QVWGGGRTAEPDRAGAAGQPGAGLPPGGGGRSAPGRETADAVVRGCGRHAAGDRRRPAGPLCVAVDSADAGRRGGGYHGGVETAGFGGAGESSARRLWRLGTGVSRSGGPARRVV